MGRIRTIKPEFFTDEDIADLPPITRLLFIGLWTLADKSGRLKDTPRTIKARILPFEGKIDIEACMNQLVEGSFIIRYVVEGVGYIQVRTWDEHQRPHHTEPPSGIPRYDNGCATVVSTCLREGKGKERKGKEGKEGERRLSVAQPEDLKLPEAIDTEEVRTAVMNWIAYKRDKGDTYQPRGLSALVNKLAKMQTPLRVCNAIEHSMASIYAGIYEESTTSNGHAGRATDQPKTYPRVEEALRALVEQDDDQVRF
jgi:hypothetical protein